MNSLKKVLLSSFFYVVVCAILSSAFLTAGVYVMFDLGPALVVVGLSFICFMRFILRGISGG